MRHIFGFLILIPLLSGCLGNDGLRTNAIADANILNLSKISVGMTQEEVLAIMKEPYKEESFALDDSKFQVWFYLTSTTLLGQTRMMPANLTPLTFKEGELVGWGASYYRFLVNRKKNIAAKSAAPSKSPPSNGPTPSGTPPPQGQKPNWGPVAPAHPVKPAADEPLPPPPPPKPQPAPQKAPAPPAKQPAAASTKALIILAASEPDSKPETEKGGSPSPAGSKKAAKKKPPLDEKDQEMLQESSDQEFNQT